MLANLAPSCVAAILGLALFVFAPLASKAGRIGLVLLCVGAFRLVKVLGGN